MSDDVRAYQEQIDFLARRLSDREAEIERLRGLIARLLIGWGSDEMGCNPEAYAAFDEAQREFGVKG